MQDVLWSFNFEHLEVLVFFWAKKINFFAKLSLYSPIIWVWTMAHMCTNTATITHLQASWSRLHLCNPWLAHRMKKVMVLKKDEISLRVESGSVFLSKRISIWVLVVALLPVNNSLYVSWVLERTIYIIAGLHIP